MRRRSEEEEEEERQAVEDVGKDLKNWSFFMDSN